MERKGKGSGERDRDKRNGRSAPPGGVPAAPAPPNCPGEASPSLLAAVRCAKAALMLFSLRSPSPATPKEELRGELNGAFASAEADLEEVAAMAGMTREMERLRRVVWIQAASQVLFAFVLCTLFFLFLDIASPPPSGYYD